mgnify:CR=1 FL=1
MLDLVLFFTALTLFQTNALLGMFVVEKWNKIKEEKQNKNRFSVSSPDEIIKHYEEMGL